MKYFLDVTQYIILTETELSVVKLSAFKNTYICLKTI